LYPTEKEKEIPNALKPFFEPSKFYPIIEFFNKFEGLDTCNSEINNFIRSRGYKLPHDKLRGLIFILSLSPDDCSLKAPSTGEYVKSILFGFDVNDGRLFLTGCSTKQGVSFPSNPIFGIMIKKSSSQELAGLVLNICSGDFIGIYELFIKHISNLHLLCKEQKLVLEDEPDEKGSVISNLLLNLAPCKQEIIVRIMFDLKIYLMAKGIWSVDKKEVCIFNDSENESKDRDYWKKHLEGLVNGDPYSFEKAAKERPEGWNKDEI